MSNKGLGTIS